MNFYGRILRPWSIDYKNISSIKTQSGNVDFIMPPPVLYRYLSFDRAKDAINKKKLWFSSPNSFNDPFDMYQGLIDFKINPERAKEFSNRVREGQPRSVRRALARDAVKRQDGLKNYQRELFENTKANSGVCCFSQHPNIALMWSHYADSHRGIVLGFNIEPVFTAYGEFFMIQPVRYMERVIAKNIYDGREETLMHWVLAKSAIWKYECEVRAFCLNRNGLLDFEQNCLKEVYLGCKLSEENKQEIIELVKENSYNDVAISKMAINPRTFDIDTISVSSINKQSSKINKERKG